MILSVPNHVEKADLIELMIQSYYSLDRHKCKYIVGCLTDTETWHYFLITAGDNSEINVKWSYLIQHYDPQPIEPQPTIIQIEYHWHFVIDVLKSQEDPYGGVEPQTQS